MDRLPCPTAHHGGSCGAAGTVAELAADLSAQNYRVQSQFPRQGKAVHSELW